MASTRKVLVEQFPNEVDTIARAETAVMWRFNFILEHTGKEMSLFALCKLFRETAKDYIVLPPA